MLSIRIRLSIDDFALAFKRPLPLSMPLSMGFIAQYALKPVLGILIAQAFGMPRIFYAGFVLTACVAGAQLSSYASYLSKSDVALSILLTSCTTIASVVVTPLLTGLLIGSVVPVDAVAMSKSILQVVLVPVTLGLLLNTSTKPVVSVVRPVMRFVAITRSQILSREGLRLIRTFPRAEVKYSMIRIILVSNLFFVSRQDEEVSRTISLFTGMQSSTLARLLATQFLGSSHGAPPACSVVAMAIMGQ